MYILLYVSVCPYTYIYIYSSVSKEHIQKTQSNSKRTYVYIVSFYLYIPMKKEIKIVVTNTKMY